jgi:hypothetical protein
MSKTKKDENMNKIKAFISGQAAKPQTISYPLEDGNELTVNVMPVLPFSKRAEMVRMIAGVVFINNGEHINDYMPEYLKLAQKISVISYYTDFKLPADVNDAWLVLNSTTLFDDVIKIVGDDIADVFAEANKLISAKVSYLVNKTDLNSFLNKVTEKLNTFSSQFTEQDLSSIMKMLEKLPKDVTPENIVKAVTAVEEEKNNVKN